jgi:thiamine-phosphate pyrophosphorylase
MIHKLNFYFIKELDKYHINKLPKNIAIIYRDYSQKYDEKKILQIKKFCKLNRRKFYLANDLALVKKLNLDGAYIPSFNTDINVIGLKTRNMTIIGSAHNIREINQKKNRELTIYLSHQYSKQLKKIIFLA